VIRLGGRIVGDVKRKKKEERMTYQGSVCNRAHAILEFSVKEIPKALVLGQILIFYLFQVAPKDFCIKSEAERSEPNRQFERVDVPPQP